MAKRHPRIADEDYLTDDDLLMGGVEGEWVRTPAWKEGHKVARDGREAVCGRPLVLAADQWQSFARAYKATFGQELPEWYLALDKRKGSKCAACKGKDYTQTYDPIAAATPEPEHTFTPHATTSADRLVSARFHSKVAYVMRELGAQVVTDS